MDLEARSWDKNRALLSTLCGPRTTSIVGRLERVWILYAGDTDDDVMEASNGLAFTFRVSRVPVIIGQPTIDGLIMKLSSLRV